MEKNTGIELMPLIQNGDEILVDARLLHKFLKAGKDFRHWIMDRIKDYNFEEGKDFFRTGNTPGSKTTQVIPKHEKQTSQKGIKNGMQIDYHITIDMAKELAMLQQNETGRLFRRYFIQKEKEARDVNKFIAPPSNVFAGLPKESINGHTLYQFAPLMKYLGYNSDTADARKKNYPNHFMKIGNLLFITEAYAGHLFKSSIILKSRRAIKAMQPVLSLDFGAPIGIK